MENAAEAAIQEETMDHEEPHAQEVVMAESTPVEEKLADEIRLRQYTEQVLDTRQIELEAEEEEKKALQSELATLKKELSNTRSQLAEARNQSKSRDKQLSDAKDQIFRLQPRSKEITEAEAVEAFRTLCGNIQRWVDNRMKPILDDLDYGRLKTRPMPAQATRLVSFMREAAKRGIDLDQSDTYHVIAIIMNYLGLVFFSKTFYCPLDDYEGDATLAFVNDIESSMGRLPREPLHCRSWRSETLTTLTSQQSFKTRRTRYINMVSEDLASLLSILAPKVSSTELHNSIRRTIIEPAADLVHQLHLATNVYSLKWPARGAWSRLEVYECLNLANGGTLMDLTGTTPTSPARRGITYMFDVAPGLFVERFSGDRKMPIKAISRPTVLVYGGNDEVSQKPTVIRWMWDTTGGTLAHEAPNRAATPKRGTVGASSNRRR